MTTFNGKHENLKFSCKDCGYRESIVINPESEVDLKRLGDWLLTHSYEGGKYENVPINEEIGRLQRIKKLWKELDFLVDEDIREKLIKAKREIEENTK